MFAAVNGTQLFYELHGPPEAPTLALCHSLGTSTALWDRQVAVRDTSLKEFRILTYDLRGHGRSTKTSVSASVEMLAGDFITLLDRLEIDRADFAGVSLGGLVGQWLGAHAPERVNRLVLANTAARLGSPEMWNARIATVREHGLTPIADGAIDRWFTPEFAAREPELIGTFRRVLLETPRDGYVAACIAIRDADHRALVPDIARPTLIVAGQADHVTPVAVGAWLADTIPGARMVTLRAAHLANVEAAADFNDAVATFLASTEA